MPQIEGFYQTHITTAATEGPNRIIKDAARTAFGSATWTTNADANGFTALGEPAVQLGVEAVKLAQL